MAENQSSLEQAVTAIQIFGFQHPDDQLLECFLCDSINPETTARYILQKYIGQQKDLSLMSLLSGWKELVVNAIEQFTHKAKTEGDIVTSVTERDGRTCCITGLKASFVDPLVVTPIFLAIPPHKERFQELLGIFVGSNLQKQIHTHDARLDDVRNHWLVRQSAAKALAQGYFRFTSTRGSDSAPSYIEILQVHTLESGWSRNCQSTETIDKKFATLLTLTFNLRVPVPRPLDLVSDADTSYLLTTTMPGQRLGSYIDVLSDDYLDIFKHDMQKYMTQLRSISRQGEQKHVISNAVGGPCYDYRIVACRDYDKERGDFFGPFTDKEEFNNILRTPALPAIFHSTGHDIVFTHSDINMRNILMHNGRISGIVDWENSGWFPDYWEYTKAHFVTKLNKRWLAVVDRIFENFGDFKLGLEIERRLWEYCF
ncbi:kinase-like domain [Fusarium agapanthi]|uniref:Kinase-like domain n=1 Tax=Fusarium agapanthi TaxID=1803897 RepID=A0A9P5B647_9HYPO|nr:kinase-like domain [Fusarium agapanthi]